MNSFHRFISYLFHPLLLYFGLTVLTYWINPYDYRFDTEKEKHVSFIMSFVILVLFPVIMTFLFKKLDFITTFQMQDKKERIAPLMVCIVLYIWYFINIKNDPSYPSQLQFVALGGVIALCMSFMVNVFSKISLHAVGAGSFLIAMIILAFRFSSPLISISGSNGVIIIAPVLIMVATLLVVGLIGTARLYLGAHRLQDVWGGFVVGIIAMIIAFRIVGPM